MTKILKKVGQIGLGAWGKNIFRNIKYLPGFELKIAADSDSKRLGAFIEDNPEITFANDYKDVINSDVDCVVISSPAPTHYQLAREALLADKDIFVEKPFTLKVEEADELIEIANRRNLIIMVGHIMLYHPAVAKLKEYVAADTLGDIYYLTANRVNLGKVRDIENAMWSFAPHDISVFLYLLEKEPIKVAATGASFLQENIQDVAFITMFFENGVIGHIHTSWLDPHKLRKMTIVGSKRMVVFEDTEPAEKIKLYDKGVDIADYDTYGEYLSLRRGDIILPQVGNDEPLMRECQHFFDAVVNRIQPLTDGKNGREVVKILNAAQESLENDGKPITLTK